MSPLIANINTGDTGDTGLVVTAYADSKLHVVLYSLELQRRLSLAGSEVRSIMTHPGIASTGLAAHSASNRINRLTWLINDVERGALSLLFAATQDVPGNSYVGPRGIGSIQGHPTIRRPSKAGLDATSATRLWQAVSDQVGARRDA